MTRKTRWIALYKSRKVDFVFGTFTSQKATDSFIQKILTVIQKQHVVDDAHGKWLAIPMRIPSQGFFVD
jgi:hypothetical protein